MELLILMFLPMLMVVKPSLDIKYSTPLSRTTDMLSVALLIGSLLTIVGSQNADAFGRFTWLIWLVGLGVSLWYHPASMFCDIAGAASVGCALCSDDNSHVALMLAIAVSHITASILLPAAKHIYGIIRTKR